MGLSFESQEVILMTATHVAGSLPIYHEMGVIETQLSAKSARTGQKMNSPSQLIKEKPALFEESLQSAGTVGGSARIGESTVCIQEVILMT